MFGLFNNKKINTPQKSRTNLVFKTEEAYFDHFCKYMDCRIRKDDPLPAIVLDASEVLGAKDPVSILADGRQMIAVKIAGDDGGFLLTTETVWLGEPILKPGDLVAWNPVEYVDEVAEKFRDKRLAWIGFVVSTVKPEIWVDKPQSGIVR